MLARCLSCCIVHPPPSAPPALRFPLPAQQGSEPVPTGRGLQQFGDGCLFVTYSLLISGLGGRKAKAAAAEEEAEAALAGARRAANERMK